MSMGELPNRAAGPAPVDAGPAAPACVASAGPAGALEPRAQGYAGEGVQRLPAALAASRVPPEMHALSRLLRGHPALAVQLVRLTEIDRMMQWPGASFDSIGEPMLAQAVRELRLLARRSPAQATSARLLDFFEGRLMRLAAARRAGG